MENDFAPRILQDELLSMNIDYFHFQTCEILKNLPPMHWLLGRYWRICATRMIEETKKAKDIGSRKQGL